MQLPKEHGYDMASASMRSYADSLQDTFYGIIRIYIGQ